MQNYLRFERYDDASRQSTTVIHPDIAVESAPHYEYGQMVQLGKGDAPSQWPRYRVIEVMPTVTIDDPERFGKAATLMRVVVVAEREWVRAQPS